MGESPASARVGVRFERLTPAVQVALDRFVFERLGRKMRARRPLDRAPAPSGPPGAERRQASRVELSGAEKLQAILQSTAPIGRLSPAKPVPTYFVADISTTGCSFLCPEVQSLKPKAKITLRLVGLGLDLQVQATVIHVTVV